MSIGTFDPGLKEDAGLAPFAAGARESKLFASVSRALAPVLFAVVWLAATGTAFAQCTGAGAPSNTETKCLTAVAIPGGLTSFDISFVNPERSEYYLADRTNKGIDIIDTASNTFKKRIFSSAFPFAGIQADNNHSGPDGVVARGRCLYTGDGDSTLKVFDIDVGEHGELLQRVDTGASPKTRLDEMALSGDGHFLLAVNNAANPPFATLFPVDDDSCTVGTGFKIEADPSVIPADNQGLSIEQPTWVELTHRFVVSVPTTINNPTANCSYGSVNPGNPPCSGAILVIDPTHPVTPVPLADTISLINCGPNGATVGPHGNVMVGCTPGNQPTNLETTIINAKTHNYVDVGNLTGSDEVWYNRGSNRYYTGSNRNPGGAVLGVVDGTTNFLVETIPQSPGSHSVAADSRRNEIFVPENATGPVSAGICGGSNGCVAVYSAPSTDE
jgi:hypothetical protein